MRTNSLASLVHRVTALALALILPGAACILEPDRAPDDKTGSRCTDNDPCTDSCGAAVVDACGVAVSCPCRSEEEAEALMPAADETLSLLLDASYMQDVFALDAPSIRDTALFRVQHTGGADGLAALAGVAAVIEGFRNGHTSMFRTDVACRDLGGADHGMTSYGVCAVPFEDGFVITHQPGSANPLGLAPGERVVAWNGQRGVEMIDGLLATPLCSNGDGHHSGRHDHAAAVLFSVLRPGDLLEIVGLDGHSREVVVGEIEAPWVECRFPAGPSAEPWIEASLRDDGILVVTLRRFILFAGEEGYIEVVTEADAVRLIDTMIAQARDVVAPYADRIRGIIWDARGNIGGASPVGFAIVAGMQSAVPTPIARCTTRIEETDPIAYLEAGPDYDIVEDNRLHVDAPAALLIDGRTVSAGDYFARATALAAPGVRIFGRPSAGAYGSALGTTLASAPELYVTYDPYRCNDVDGAPLETHPTVPDELVDLAPADLAAGVDTVVERAAEHLLAAGG